VNTEHLIHALGEPDEVVSLGPGREQWRYRTGLRLHGVALLLIVVPIPLLVPTGVHDTYVVTEQGTVLQIRGSLNSDLARIGCIFGTLAALSAEEGCFARRGRPPSRLAVGSGELWLGAPPTLTRAPPPGASP
jgi:hypothetical protein